MEQYIYLTRDHSSTKYKRIQQFYPASAPTQALLFNENPYMHLNPSTTLEKKKYYMLDETVKYLLIA